MENIINVGLVRDYIKKYNLSVKEFCKNAKFAHGHTIKLLNSGGK